MGTSRVRINRVYFMIHPTCWAEHPDGPPDTFAEGGGNHSDWYAALNWEREVNERQKQLIDDMGPDEALVVYPIGSSPQMRELEEHGERTLGRRCVIVRSPVCREPEALDHMAQPIRRFLQDRHMDGRDEFWSVVPPQLRDEVRAEIQAACDVSGYDWSPAALKVITGNRTYAQEIAEEFDRRGLDVDPASVRAEAYGEGFEQCAITWKAMVADYLGWANPIENRFDLSVSGAPVLFDAEFKEMVTLDRDIRLFLWQKSRGRPLALFTRARSRLADPHYEVDVPLDGLVLEAWSVREKLWPAAGSQLTVREGFLKVPVLSGIRKAREEETCYLIGCNVSLERFRDLLVNAAKRHGAPEPSSVLR